MRQNMVFSFVCLDIDRRESSVSCVTPTNLKLIWLSNGVAERARSMECRSLNDCALWAVPKRTACDLTALFPGQLGILIKQEMMGCQWISWTICKSFAPCSRQITTPVPHHSSFNRLDALPVAQPTVSKHWGKFHTYHMSKRQFKTLYSNCE